MNNLNKKTMDLKELYKKEKGFGVDIEVGGLSIIYYSEDYVKWLEAKINYTRCCKSDSELLKVLEYSRQIKNNPKEIQLIIDRLYVDKTIDNTSFCKESCDVKDKLFICETEDCMLRKCQKCGKIE